MFLIIETGCEGITFVVLSFVGKDGSNASNTRLILAYTIVIN